MSSVCEHGTLTFSSSANAVTSGYRHYSNWQVRTNAGAPVADVNFPTTILPVDELNAFPAALVLPGDEIVCDPNYPRQSYRDWRNLGDRNHVTSSRKILYVAAPPDIDSSAGHMQDWQRSVWDAQTATDTKPGIGAVLDAESIAAYLRAFYDGMEVRILPQKLAFSAWDDDPPNDGRSLRRKASRQLKIAHVALSTGTELIRIRGRSTPPTGRTKEPELFPFSHQLNLNDLADAAMTIVPSNAYALLMLTNHDLYEDDDDDFCCGRA
ncbi:hypothetical protein EDD37DRAFT_677127 [Exophiala viscosa]|uniref:uncharacterized protein n=1 Tax=Exophiala viscosa TaxID=2486360 RepID=UPI0021A16217|nr:hypothetical protein EDD37DRAFT_677127 [Exophiala viscosa]